MDNLRAEVTNPRGFRCAPDGHTVEVYLQGSIVQGQVARWAVDSGDASYIPAYETKIVAPEEVKTSRRKRKAA